MGPRKFLVFFLLSLVSLVGYQLISANWSDAIRLLPQYLLLKLTLFYGFPLVAVVVLSFFLGAWNKATKWEIKVFVVGSYLLVPYLSAVIALLLVCATQNLCI
jgi:hypothetical protein